MEAQVNKSEVSKKQTRAAMVSEVVAVSTPVEKRIKADVATELEPAKDGLTNTILLTFIEQYGDFLSARGKADPRSEEVLALARNKGLIVRHKGKGVATGTLPTKAGADFAGKGKEWSRYEALCSEYEAAPVSLPVPQTFEGQLAHLEKLHKARIEKLKETFGVK